MVTIKVQSVDDIIKAYLQTHNIFTSTFAHMIHNTLSVIVVIFGV